MTALQFSKVVVPVYNPTTMCQSSYSSIPLVALGIIRLFNFSQYGISFKNILSWDNFKLREKLQEQYTKLPYSLYLDSLIFNILPYFSFPLMYMMILWEQVANIMTRPLNTTVHFPQIRALSYIIILWPSRIRKSTLIQHYYSIHRPC